MKSKTIKLRRLLKNTQIKKILIIFLLGLALRVFFLPYFYHISTDLLIVAEWGERFWEYGSKNVYFESVWRLGPPNYPPLSILYYALAYKLYAVHVLFAQIHNATKLIPGFFVAYFYEYGYYHLLALPSYLSDLALGLIAYKYVYKFTRNAKRSLFALGFLVLNPVSIFLSSFWGQIDSLVALLGLSAFMLIKKRPEIALPLYFAGLYMKPNWALLLPLFAFVIIIQKPKIKGLVLGAVWSFLIFYLVSIPFAGDGVIDFTIWLFRDKLIHTAGLSQLTSVSAFNLYTVFTQIDAVSHHTVFLGLSLKNWGLIIFACVNLFAFNVVRLQKAGTRSLLFAIFTVSLSSYLFLTNMLERYFFPGCVPMIILMFTSPKTVLYGILINLGALANIYYSFFRRTSEAVSSAFSAHDWLPIRAISLINVFSWLMFVRSGLEKQSPSSGKSG